jgi:hypothetical protein
MVSSDRARVLVAVPLVCGSLGLIASLPAQADAERVERVERPRANEWTHAAWSPECPILQADAAVARAAVTPVSWAPCEGVDLAGCRQMTTKPLGIRSLADVSIASAPSGAVRIAMTRELDGEAAAEVTWESVIWDSDAGIRAAWRSGAADCAPKIGSLEGGVPSMSVARVEGSSSGYVDTRAFWHVVGQPEELLLRTRADVTFDGASAHGAYFDRVLASERTMAFYYGASNQLWVMDRASQARTEMRLDGGAPLFCELGPVIAHDAVLFSDQRTIWKWTNAHGLVALRSSAGVAVHDVGSDGTTIAWLESKDEDLLPNGDYARATLFTSPAVDAPVPIATATIACPATRCQLVVSNGHVIVGGRSAYNVVRLSDARAWHVGTGSGAVWVAADEMWMVARNSVVRVPLASLADGLEP